MMLSTFSGRKTEFPAYKNAYLTLAQQSSSLCQFNHGLLGFVLTPAEYQILTFPVNHIPAPFAPLQYPGLEPNLANDANALAVSRHNAEWASWKFQHEQFQKQQAELNAFKLLFLQSLDKTTLQRLSHPINGTRQLSVADIHAFLGARFGTMVSVDLISLSSTLAAPHRLETPIENLLQKHRDAHGIAASQQQPFPEYQKVQLFRVAVKPCGIFEPCILAWLLANATVATQTFDSLATAILSFSDNFDQTSTAASLGYSAAVEANSLPPAIPIQDLIASAVSAALLAHSTPSSPKPTPSKQGTKYCWTHGIQGSHTSQECQHRRNGHKERASLANKMGGKA